MTPNTNMRFYCDDKRCIDCHGCEVACKEAHHLPVGVNRRRVVTLNEGVIGKETYLSIACQHCADAPCEQVCPVDCFYVRADGIVLHDKDTCIGCGYCLYACPFGAPQFPRDGVFGAKGSMDKCTMCAGGPEETHSEKEYKLYGQNRIAEGKIPVCAAMCSTKALLVGDATSVSKVITERVLRRGSGSGASESAMWKTAYKK